MKNIYLIILSALIFSGDNTPTTTKIEGVVFQKDTNIPVVNAAVVFSQFYSEGGLPTTVEWNIDTIYTNEAGEFIWETDIDPYNSTYETLGGFRIGIVSAENYYDATRQSISMQGNEVRFLHLAQEKLTIEMTPHAYIDLSLINEENPASNYCKFVAINTGVTEELYNENLSERYIVPGNTMINYQFTTDPSLQSWERDSMYFEAFQTLELEYIY